MISVTSSAMRKNPQRLPECNYMCVQEATKAACTEHGVNFVPEGEMSAPVLDRDVTASQA